MEEIDLEYSKIKLAFARASTSENSLLYDLSNDLIDNIREKFKELYFEACLKIYTRSSMLISVLITILSVTQGRFKNGGGRENLRRKKENLVENLRVENLRVENLKHVVEEDN